MGLKSTRILRPFNRKYADPAKTESSAAAVEWVLNTRGKIERGKTLVDPEFPSPAFGRNQRDSRPKRREY